MRIRPELISRAILALSFLTTGTMALAAEQNVAPQSNPDANSAAAAIVKEYENEVLPLEYKVNLAWWQANTTGTDDAFTAKEQAQNAYDQALANSDRFNRLKQLMEISISTTRC